MQIANREIGAPRDSAKLKRALRISAAPFLLAVHIAFLEQELQAELEDAAQVCAGRLEETGPAAGGAGSVARGIIGATVAADGAVHAIPLSVIENVEGLGAELKRIGLLDGEILVQRHVEIQAVRNVQRIASDVAESQALRRSVGGRIEEQRP